MSNYSQNSRVVLYMLKTFSSGTVLFAIISILLSIFGGIALFRKNKVLFICIVVPIFLLLASASLHKFTLIPRVSLFISPIFLILISFGISRLFEFKLKIISLIVYIILLVDIFQFQSISFFYNKPQYQSAKQHMEWTISRYKSGDQIYVQGLEFETDEYYLKIHPDSAKWALFKNAHTFGGPDFETIANSLNAHQNAFFMFSWIDGDDVIKMTQQYNNYFNNIDSIMAPPLNIILKGMPKPKQN